MRPASRLLLLFLVSCLAAVLLLTSRPAHADIVAAYVEGHGGLSSADGANRAPSSSGRLAPGLGIQLGARVLIFEGYFDHTAFGSGASVSRGILGLRGAVGAGGLRLVLRAGAGMIVDEGGALGGSQPIVGERRGAVAAAGLALEKRLTPAQLFAGVGLEGEVFSLESSTGSSSGVLAPRNQGSDIFLSFRLKFELGI